MREYPSGCLSVARPRPKSILPYTWFGQLGILIATSTAAVVGIVVMSYLVKFAKTRRIYMVDFVLGSIALILGIIVTPYTASTPPAIS